MIMISIVVFVMMIKLVFLYYSVLTACVYILLILISYRPPLVSNSQRNPYILLKYTRLTSITLFK